MSQEVIATEVKLGTAQAEKAISNIKKELKDANAELIAAQRNFGDYSNEALAAAKRVAELKDAIGEAKETADLFDPGNKLKVLGGVLNTAAAGFSTLTSATALFGSESQELEKTLLKVQSAMALSQGVSTILDSGKDFARLGAIIRTNVVSAFSTLRGAIISTGIGALVVAIGLIIANFEEFQKVMEKIFPGFGKFISFIKDGIQALTDFVGITSEAERALEAQNEALQKSIDSSKEWLERNGDQYDEFTKKKISATAKYNEELIKLNKDETKSEAQKQKERAEWYNWHQRQVAQADKDRASLVAKGMEDQRKKDEEERKKNLEKQKEKQAAIEEAERQHLERLRKMRNDDATIVYQTAKERQAEEDAREAERRDKEQKETDERTAKFTAAIGDRATQYVSTIRQLGDAQTELNKRVILSEEEKFAMISSFANQFADLIGRNTAVGKAAAIASTVIDTYSAASSIFRNAAKNPASIPFPAYPYIQAAFAIASGLQRVRAIAAVQVPRGGGGGSAPSISAGGASAPSAPLRPQAETTTLNQAQVNQIGAATVRAYVVQTEINSAQEREIRVQKAARIN